MMEWIPLIGALGAGGLCGTLITQFMTGRREKAVRATAFRKQQLEEFYGPLLAMHKEIRARGALRVKLQNAIDTGHVKDMIDAGPGNIEAASDLHVPTIMKIIRDESSTLREVLMPRYRDMLTVFREKMWLAEPETRQHHEKLIEFVDVWDKVLADKLPASVAPAIGHREENLAPFYRHLEEVHDRLRSEIK